MIYLGPTVNTNNKFINKFNSDNPHNIILSVIEYFPEQKIFQYSISHASLKESRIINLQKDLIRILINDTMEMHLFRIKLVESLGIKE